MYCRPRVSGLVGRTFCFYCEGTYLFPVCVGLFKVTWLRLKRVAARCGSGERHWQRGWFVRLKTCESKLQHTFRDLRSRYGKFWESVQTADSEDRGAFPPICLERSRSVTPSSSSQVKKRRPNKQKTCVGSFKLVFPFLFFLVFAQIIRESLCSCYINFPFVVGVICLPFNNLNLLNDCDATTIIIQYNKECIWKSFQERKYCDISVTAFDIDNNYYGFEQTVQT